MGKQTLLDGTSDLGKIEFWVLLIYTVSFATLHICFLNTGLQRFEVVVYNTTYTSALIMMGTILGTIYYEEYKEFTRLGFIMVVFGVVLVCIGVSMLTVPN